MLLLLTLACTSPGAAGKDHQPPGDTAGDTAGDTGTESADDSAHDSGADSAGDSPGDSADSADSGDSPADSGGDDPVVEPPFGGTSGGDGGADAPSSTSVTVGGTTYKLLAPTGSAAGRAVPLLIVISGTEGADTMMSNMRQVARYAHLDDALIAVLDGRSTRLADATAVLDDVRADFDVDNDRTWLLSESAGTAVGLQLGLDARTSFFAAYWANDVNARGTPSHTAAELGVAPWGNAGPGGDQPDADAIVAGMRDAGWQLPADAPYSGPGSETHGSTDQFLEAVSFFHDKVREGG